MSRTVTIDIPSGMVTSKSVAWGGTAPERYHASQEAIRYALQASPDRETLAEWLNSRTRLHLAVKFHLSASRVHLCDLDSLLYDLMNPLVEGACGPREAGRPIPQTKDALFWSIHAVKVLNSEERTVLHIQPWESESGQ